MLAYGTVTLINDLIGSYLFFMFIFIVLGWVRALGLVSYQNKFVGSLVHFLSYLYEPVFGFVRKKLPFVIIGGAVDLSPIFVYVSLSFLQVALYSLVA